MDSFKNLEKAEELLKTKAFHELTTEELDLIWTLVDSEEEYELLRQTELGLKKTFGVNPEIVVRPETLRKVKLTWSQKETANNNIWTVAYLPNYAALLLVSIVSFLCWIGGASLTPKIQYVEKIKLDTVKVFITSKPDTIYRNKIIYVNIPSTKWQIAQTLNSSLIKSESTKGINMKEKEELEKLLVSGSY